MFIYGALGKNNFAELLEDFGSRIYVKPEFAYSRSSSQVLQVKKDRGNSMTSDIDEFWTPKPSVRKTVVVTTLN
jgi:hypothetical protein